MKSIISIAIAFSEIGIKNTHAYKLPMQQQNFAK